MRTTLWLWTCIVLFFGACAARQTPETAEVDRNVEATFRVDVLGGGHGTAVVLDGSGYLLTCHHVAFAPTGEMRVLIVNIAVDGAPATAYPANVVAYDMSLDLAVLKVPFRFPNTVKLGNIRDVHLLDAIYEIGFPYDLGEMAGYGHVKNVRWTDAGRGLDNALGVELGDGNGISGSGVFLVRNGRLIGLTHQMTAAVDGNRPVLDGRQALVRVAIPVDAIRAYLEREHIPYHK